MIKIINKAYLVIIFFALWGLYERFEEIQTSNEQNSAMLDSVNASIVKVKKDRRKIDDYLKNIDIKKGEIEEVAIQIEKLQKKLPQKATDSENVSLIRKSADLLKIRDVEVNPGVETENGFYFSKIYAVQGVGTYLQFLMLLEALSTSERILNLKNLVIERSETRIKGRYEVLKMTAVIESYRYNENYKEDRGISEIETNFKSGKLKVDPNDQNTQAGEEPQAGAQ